MAHIDIEQTVARPRLSIAAQRQVEASRTKHMLVATVVASAMILVVAALFMTMF